MERVPFQCICIVMYVPLRWYEETDLLQNIQIP